MDDQDLINYSNGAYSRSDVGCAGDTIGISPRPYPVPGYLLEYYSWAKALHEATQICELENGVCWMLRPRDIGVRCGQRAGGGCPTCIPAPGVVQRHAGMSGLEAPRSADPCAGVWQQGYDEFNRLLAARPGQRAIGKWSSASEYANAVLAECRYQHAKHVPHAPRQWLRLSGVGDGASSTVASGFPDEVRREVGRRWDPVAVVTPQGVAKVLPDGCVLPLWDRIFYVSPPGGMVHEQDGLLYTAAVRAAQVIAAQSGKPRVVGARKPRGGTVPVVYVDPGGIVHAIPAERGPETNAYSMDPLEVRQFFAASRGGSLMPWGM